MSKEALAKVVQRAISDGAFRRQLSSDPATALRGFDLSPDESAAIRSGDAGRLTAMGVELRMSKAFTLSTDNAPGMGVNSGVNSVLSNDLGASFTGAANSGVNFAGNSALLSGVNSAGNASLDAGMNSAAGNAALISGVNSGSNLNQPILTDDSAASGQGAVIGGGPEHALGALTGGEGASATGALDDANAEGFLTPVHTINEGTINPVAITTESAGASSALTGGAAAAGNADLTDANEGYLTSVHTGGDNAMNDVLVVDDNGISGAASPGEAAGGPNLQQ